MSTLHWVGRGLAGYVRCMSIMGGIVSCRAETGVGDEENLGGAWVGLAWPLFSGVCAWMMDEGSAGLDSDEMRTCWNGLGWAGMMMMAWSGCAFSSLVLSNGGGDSG
jgi:hypothetical protein